MSQDLTSDGRPSDRGPRADFIGSLNNSIRENPVPAALVGVGILWLLVGGRKVRLGSASRSIISGMGRGARDVSDAAYRGVREVGGRAADGIRGISEDAGEAGAVVTSAVHSAADAMGGAVTRTAETVRETASDATDWMWSRAGTEAGAGTHVAKPFSVTDHISDVQDILAELFKRRPLLVGAVGAAIGAGIAASLPVSGTENRLMGDTADAVKEGAEELWTETKRRGVDLASRGLEEAEAQGLTPEAAGKAARSLTSKVASVAEKAGNDIVDRTRR